MPSGLTTILAIFGSVVGLYGAILASLNAYWNWRDRHASIRIQLFATIGPSEAGAQMQVPVQAQNIGTQPVTLTGAGYILPNKHQFWIARSPTLIAPFPHEILAGQNYSLHTPVDVVVNDLRSNGLTGIVELHGFGNSAIGKVFSGGKLRLDLEKGEIVFGRDKRMWAVISGISK